MKTILKGAGIGLVAGVIVGVIMLMLIRAAVDHERIMRFILIITTPMMPVRVLLFGSSEPILQILFSIVVLLPMEGLIFGTLAGAIVRALKRKSGTA